ncbi:MAG TPA: hypothetical protein VJ653_05645 [Acidimicrobiales bacterium]|nr:hypothetical protein [Acidimicrobiales bacterium]
MSIPLSEFKATCLAALKRAMQSALRVLVNRRGKPARRGSWLGSARGSGEILGDLVAPAADREAWEALS